MIWDILIIYYYITCFGGWCMRQSTAYSIRTLGINHAFPQHLPPLVRHNKSVASRSVRMRVPVSIAEPIPACEEHLHSRAHGFSHGLPADADVELLRLWCCCLPARPSIHPCIHSQHPDTEREDQALWDTQNHTLNDGSKQRQTVPFLHLRPSIISWLCFVRDVWVSRGSDERETPCASRCQMDFLNPHPAASDFSSLAPLMQHWKQP